MNSKEARALHAFQTILKADILDIEIYSYRVRGSSQLPFGLHRPKEPSCRIIYKDSIEVNCSGHRTFTENFVVCCALCVYVIRNSLYTCEDRYGFWKVVIL